MLQTPVHDIHNAELLSIIPKNTLKLIEIGCSSGALAREFKRINKDAHWVGVEIDASYALLARRYCDETLVADFDVLSSEFFDSFKDRHCWIFADVLEHLKDPWSALKKIRRVIPKDGSIVACIPNAQNWWVIAKLALGEFRYEDSGLLDRTHLRWFTRKTIIELFEQEGFRIVEGLTRVFQVPDQNVLRLVVELAQRLGVDPEVVKHDATVFQYVVRAVPV